MKTYWLVSNVVLSATALATVVVCLVPADAFSSGGMFGDLGKDITRFFLSIGLGILSLNLGVASVAIRVRDLVSGTAVLVTSLAAAVCLFAALWFIVRFLEISGGGEL